MGSGAVKGKISIVFILLIIVATFSGCLENSGTDDYNQELAIAGEYVRQSLEVQQQASDNYLAGNYTEAIDKYKEAVKLLQKAREHDIKALNLTKDPTQIKIREYNQEYLHFSILSVNSKADYLSFWINGDYQKANKSIENGIIYRLKAEAAITEVKELEG